jgi:2-methylcitrate dehydratase
MKRRDFLARTTAGASASVLLGNVRSDGYRFVGSALAAGEADSQKAMLEQKFAEFALSIKYEALPTDVIVAAKRVLLDTLGCAFGSVGSEPANIAEATIRLPQMVRHLYPRRSAGFQAAGRGVGPFSRQQNDDAS